MRNAFYILVSIAIGFLIGYFCQPKAIQETTITRVDTVRIEVPRPVEIEKVRTEYVYVPTPADTVVREVVRVDSVLVAVNIERREYRDSLYRAIVSGPTISGLRPSLDEIEFYNTTTTIKEKIKTPLVRPFISAVGGKNSFGIGAGVEVKDHYIFSVDCVNHRGENELLFHIGYKL